jgi:recombination protein RecA
MAKSKKESENFFDKFVKSSKIKGLQQATVLKDSPYVNVSDWISTGSYALNKVLSGSYFKGIPSGRITGLAGPSGCGKSFICGNCIREAQKKGYKVAVFDSENAIDNDFYDRIGVITEDLLRIPALTVNDVKNTASKMMTQFKENHPDEKLFIVIDSVTGLSTEKQLYDDVEKDSTAQDMGLFAKQIRALAKVLTHNAAMTDTPVLFTNHIWVQPAANPKAAPITKMNGGEGLIYAASAIAYLRAKKEWEDVKGKGKKITGCFLTASTEKNRFVPQGAKAEIWLSFKKGMNKWYGMLDEAIEYGFIKQAGAWYNTVDQETGEVLSKCQGASKLYTKEIWEPILETLNAKVESEFKFADMVDDDAIDSLVEMTEKEEKPE